MVETFDISGVASSVFLIDFDLVAQEARCLGRGWRDDYCAVVHTEGGPGGIDRGGGRLSVDVFFEEGAVELSSRTCQRYTFEDGSWEELLAGIRLRHEARDADNIA